MAASTTLEGEATSPRNPGAIEQLQRRRTQVWSLALFVIAAMTGVVALLSLRRDLLPEALRLDDLPRWIVIVLAVGLALAFLIYVVEQERTSRRLLRALIAEHDRSQKLMSRLSEITATAELSKSLRAVAGLQGATAQIAATAKELLDADEASLMLLDDSGTKLDVVAYEGSSPDKVAGGSTNLGDHIAGLVAAGRTPMLLQGDDVPEGCGRPERKIHSAISVPLVGGSDPIGVLNVSELSGRRKFTAEDVSALELFAEHAAAAIAHVRLFQKERDAVQRLEQLDRMRRDFVATVSHDLRTPLTAIIGGAKTLRRRLGDMPIDQQTVFVDMIERQSQRLLRLVEDVLAASRMEAEPPKMRRRPIDLRALADRVVDDLQHTKIATGRDVVVEAGTESPQAWGDPVGVEQVLSNLVDNALKYSKPPSQVRVKVADAPLEATFEVRDHGHGIDPDQLPGIFDRFRQVNRDLRAGGVGLGLYIVKNIIDAHNGRIEVHSELGKGTIFRVHLPKRSEEHAG